MFMLPSAIIKCRNGLEFAEVVRFARKNVDNTFFAGHSTNSLIFRWIVETTGLDCKLCVRIQQDDTYCKTDWNTEEYYRTHYPQLPQVNIEDYDTYGCYANILLSNRLYGCRLRKTIGELKEYNMEKEQKYYDYLESLRESGVTNMIGAVPYLQTAFPELRNDRERAKEILLSWIHSVERSATE